MQHPFPIRILIRPGKDSINQLDQPVQQGDVESDQLGEIRPLNFYGNFFARMQTGTVNLSE